MKILITGVPGVGKTTMSKKISEEQEIMHIDISELIKREKLYDFHNDELDSFEFNSKVVEKYLNNNYKELDNFIIDTHSPSVARSIKFDKIYLLTTDRKILYERYKERGYSFQKITENLDAQEFQIIDEEIEEYFPNSEIFNITT